MRLFILMLLIIGSFEIVQDTVHASNPCQDACASSYTTCTQDATLQKEICDLNVSNEEQICLNTAEWNHDSCLDICIGHTACINSCDAAYDYDKEYCYATRAEQTAACGGAFSSAMDNCGNTYTSCYNNCPP